MRPFSLMHMHRKPQIIIGYRTADSIYLLLAAMSRHLISHHYALTERFVAVRMNSNLTHQSRIQKTDWGYLCRRH